jgi:isochorismate hydrolase
MKELYFTRESIEGQAAALLRQVNDQVRKKPLPFSPGQSALLVLDMQAYFLDPGSHAYIPSAQAIVAGITQLVEAYAALGRPIIFTQHINTTEDAGMMSRWWKDLITAQNPLQQIIPAIDLGKGRLIQKSQYDAFFHTPLEDLLRTSQVRQLVLCGVMTHLCCETTARSAFMRGFEVFFPVDGTATYTLEHHQASLVNLAHGFASIILMKDILAAVRGKRES